MATAIPENRAPFTIEEIVRVTGGRLVGGGGDRADRVEGVTTDSRGDVRGKLFVALAGERFDGHDHAHAAAKAGAAAVLASRDVDAPRVVRVPDTLTGLGALSRAHRASMTATVVAIGGSAGKTTTRVLVSRAAELVHPGGTHALAGNLNNRVGVPMVLFGLARHHSVGVVEIGTNLEGEVATLAAMAAPDIAVLTLVGLEHSEGLGTLDDIEREEGALLDALGPGGVAIANGDDARVRRRLDACPARSKIAYGLHDHCQYRLTRRTLDGVRGSKLSIARPGGEIEVACPLLGEPGAFATLAALAVADTLAGAPVDPRAFESALEGAGEPGRLVPIELRDGTLVLDDTYNANPPSVRASIAVAREVALARGARLVLVLGEMRELGAVSREEHRALAPDVRAAGAILVTLSGDAKELASAMSAPFAADADAAVDVVLDAVLPGDVVLVKASRGVHAERVVDALVRERGSGA